MAFIKLDNTSEKKFKRWVGSTEILLGMTNTYARVAITVISYLVLVGWGFYSLHFETAAVGYAIALLVCLVLQAASVRFIFNWDEVIDEYQSKRRDAAYRKAYKRIRQIFLVILLLWFIATFVVGYIQDHSGLKFESPLYMDNYRSVVVAIFLAGLMTLQKYVNYGMKGEPFVSVQEWWQLRDS